MKSLLKKYLLPITVFLTGGCVLIVEVVATRILSPYFGNTIFTVSSVISVILAALSIGYAAGGKIADHHPTLKWFFGFIAISGLLLLGFHLLSIHLLPIIGQKTSIIIGPLISSLLFFFFPSMVLGTLSPYAVVIQRSIDPDRGVGSIAGRIFFWSTLGSIAGSLSAGFILIPHLGINLIMISNGIILFFIGFIPLTILHLPKRHLITLLGLSIILVASMGISMKFIRADGVVFQKDGDYERLSIQNETVRGRPARVLMQDHTLSGGMFLDTTSSLDLVFPYASYFAMYQVSKTDVQRALLIGGGSYTVPKIYQSILPHASIDIAEIEPSLPDLAKTYFDFHASTNTHLINDDGRRVLRNASEPYDLIFSDVYYSFFSIPSHFTTKEFFTLAKERLSPNGIFIANVLGDLSRQQPSLFFSEIKTFQSIFPNMQIFAVEDKRTGPQNFIFVGYNSETPIDLGSIVQKPDATPFIKDLPNHLLDLSRFDLTPYPILTDDYAPTDYLTARTIERIETSPHSVNGNEITALVEQQKQYGSQALGSKGHEQELAFIQTELQAQIKTVQDQTWTADVSDGSQIHFKNILGRLSPEKKNRIVIQTNINSASGVAILLHLADILSRVDTAPNVGVDFVFFDGDPNISDSPGSRYFEDHLADLYGEARPVATITADTPCKNQCNIKQLGDIAQGLLNNIYAK